MYCYKEMKDNRIVSYQRHRVPIELENFIEITESEYKLILRELEEKNQKESEMIEQSKDERIAELEAENAALLYQVLTGEEFTDV